MNSPKAQHSQCGGPGLSGRGIVASTSEGFSPARAASASQEKRTFFVTSASAPRRAIFQSKPMANLLADVLQEYRRRQKFLLHQFVIMPDHFHALLTPPGEVSLEKALQYIKGGFSYRARKELTFLGEIWEKSFSNHRIRDSRDYDIHCEYIWKNPVKRFLCRRASEFPYSSAFPAAEVDPAPPWLKPLL
jgi:putative transposase